MNTHTLTRRIADLETEHKAAAKLIATLTDERDKAVSNAASLLGLREENNRLKKTLLRLEGEGS